MPISPPSICTGPGCGTLVYKGGRCPACLAESRAELDKRRGSSARRGYDAKWQATRRAYLADHPYCECPECAHLPLWNRPEATDVDHIDGLGPKGPRGHDWSNLQALTAAHHARKTATQDGGFGRRRGGA